VIVVTALVSITLVVCMVMIEASSSSNRGCCISKGHRGALCALYLSSTQNREAIVS
jgi:hypothetical protein